ncbi:protein-export membrane protein SecD (TC 3.A.5.1 .1) / Protein-export membrane protein SecF (TC 3.A.5.1.1) [Formosa agariphila KMM 3901]|uniref:Multifunctional fusion protein n=1 Tax=Formosa agariphila (strain DSM 15362 / KCTC 12365 / LMG 23005 / KMM 3901 / M-2Alg 35-1) TaxID=1347342 RepID=T2KK36_FORAG|nr:protein translocase subunit SecDF [Formosa agariphila]CDF78354.1 protein-export membrane protein SecD (TC 3.A.5.1 .1) / Protein-export membrane protein SecF (TC 3.A.5.1.1) [Formosa agariphila KMM 3901]
MQNKGLVKLFAVLFGLVSIYQLSFTFKANSIDDAAKAYSNGDSAKEARYLDSLSTEKVFNLGIADYTYDEVKDKAMNLGLDLKGGINVILQVSVKDILKGLANHTSEPAFNKALDDASELQKNSQNTYLEDFYIAFDKIKGDTKLASPDIFANRSLSEEITFDMTDDQVKPIIDRKIDESITSAFEVLRKRIDEFGVTSPNIQRLGESGRILVELPGVKDVERAKKLLQSTAQLEFWDAYKGEQFIPFIIEANNILVSEVAENTKTTEDAATETSESDSQIDDLLGEAVTDSTSAATNPLLDLIIGQGYQGGPVIAQFDIKDKQTVLDYLNRPDVRALLPAEQRYAKFAFGMPEKNSDAVSLYALIGNRENVPPMSGAVVTNATQQYDQLGKPSVSMQMNAKGAKVWEELTGKAFAQQSQIAIVLDNIVYSAPGVTTGAIAGGNSEISGNFTLNEAVDLANVLRAGKLPASADIIQSEVVGPSLGQEAIDSGEISFVIALVLVLVWMLFYYGKAGGFADIAMALNILLIFGVLSGLGAVLTLPGIAGIVLTIGMSVDANVLIFERIREEISNGKGQREAIQDGFSNALSSILDANITTGLTALILFIFGTGPIKGFATTLLIGIVTSLFTAIFITRLLIDWYVNRGGNLDFSTGITKNLFRNINIEFLKKRKLAYILSGTLIVISLGSLFTNGLDQGVDFVGGRNFQVRFNEAVSPSELVPTLDNAFGSADAKTFGSANQVKITTKYKVDETSAEVDEQIRKDLYTALEPHLTGISYEDFISDNEHKTVGLMKSYKVSPTIADDIKKESFWAVLGSLIVVFLYILLRFKKWQYSLGAVAAVFHDVIIVLGVFSLTYKFMPFNMEIDQAFIAAILTVIGYSLNDTVVVFDRIREYFQEHTGWNLNKVVNVSLSSTLSRTLNTSLTTLVVLLAIFTFGGDSIRGFMFALIVGVVVGTYSSLFIATPIMYDTLAASEKKRKLTEGEGVAA